MKLARNPSKAPVERDDLGGRRRPRRRRLRPLRRRRLRRLPQRADPLGRRRHRGVGAARLRPRSRGSGPPRGRRRSSPSASSSRCPTGPSRPRCASLLPASCSLRRRWRFVALAPAALIAPRWVKHALLDEARVRRSARGGRRRRLWPRFSSPRTSLTAGRSTAGLAAPARAGRRRGRCGSASTRPVGTWSSARSERWWSRRKRALGKALSIGVVVMDLPGRSARAFLRGCYRLEGAGAEPALRASYVAAAVATVVGAVAVVAAFAAALLL